MFTNYMHKKQTCNCGALADELKDGASMLVTPLPTTVSRHQRMLAIHQSARRLATCRLVKVPVHIRHVLTVEPVPLLTTQRAAVA